MKALLLRSLALFSLCTALAGASAHAQLALPGAVAPDSATTQRPVHKARKAKPKTSFAGIKAESLNGKPLLLNGVSGQLQISVKGDVVNIERLRLAGEDIANPSQRCLIDIVGEKPIEARSLGIVDGVERYQSDIPVCPFTFDVLSGAVLAPPQTTACVFKAANCAANPGGLWGPDGATLEKSAAGASRERTGADEAMLSHIQALQAHYKGKPEADDLNREQSDFATWRADVCRDYVRESALGFCATRLTQARTLALRERLEALARKRPAAQ